MKAKDLMLPIRDYLKPDSNLKEAVNLLQIAVRGEEKFGVMGFACARRKGNAGGNAFHDGHS